VPVGLSESTDLIRVCAPTIWSCHAFRLYEYEQLI